MTKKDQNIINVLAAMSNNSYEMYKFYERHGEHDKALQYIKESGAYYTAAKIIAYEKCLKINAKIFNVELIKE